MKTTRRIIWEGRGLGVIAASLTLSALLSAAGAPGAATQTQKAPLVFSVAVMAGAKQAAQTAPDSAAEVVEVTTSSSEAAPIAVSAEVPTSLPDAVKAAPLEAAPGTAEAASVLPPATVAMPGGRLALDDLPVGGDQVTLGVVGRQVSLKLLIDEKGRAVFGEIERPGPDAIRDQMILRIMLSRQYRPEQAAPIQVNGRTVWQVNVVIPYGNMETLP